MKENTQKQMLGATEGQQITLTEKMTNLTYRNLNCLVCILDAFHDQPHFRIIVWVYVYVLFFDIQQYTTV